MRKLKKCEEFYLSIRNLKLNKKRTISTIIGIILSVALICAVATMATSFQETLVQNAINETGNYHIKISNISSTEENELKNNNKIKVLSTLNDVGYAKLEEIENENKPYVHLYSMNEETFKNLKLNLIEGKFPTNENEIIISKHIKTNGKVNLKIGDTITLNVGDRVAIDNESLNQNNPYTNTPIYIEKGKTAHYHLCWNLINQQLAPENITFQCKKWIEDIAERVSGHPRIYVDRTIEILEADEKNSLLKKNIMRNSYLY